MNQRLLTTFTATALAITACSPEAGEVGSSAPQFTPAELGATTTPDIYGTVSASVVDASIPYPGAPCVQFCPSDMIVEQAHKPALDETHTIGVINVKALNPDGTPQASKLAFDVYHNSSTYTDVPGDYSSPAGLLEMTYPGTQFSLVPLGEITVASPGDAAQNDEYTADCSGDKLYGSWMQSDNYLGAAVLTAETEAAKQGIHLDSYALILNWKECFGGRAFIDHSFDWEDPNAPKFKIAAIANTYVASVEGHELGHLIGLDHTGYADCFEGLFTLTNRCDYYVSATQVPGYENGEYFDTDIMAKSYPSTNNRDPSLLNNMDRMLLGQIPIEIEAITDLKKPQEILLTATDNTESGTHLATIPYIVDGQNNGTIAIEYSYDMSDLDNKSFEGRGGGEDFAYASVKAYLLPDQNLEKVIAIGKTNVKKVIGFRQMKVYSDGSYETDCVGWSIYSTTCGSQAGIPQSKVPFIAIEGSPYKISLEFNAQSQNGEATPFVKLKFEPIAQ